MSFVAKADLNSLKYHLEHYTLRYADGFSPPTSPQFPPLVHPRSYRPYIMTQSFTGGDGIEDGSLAALEGSEPALVSPLAGDNLGPSSSSSHPSRPSSPPLAGGAAFYTPYPQSQPIVAAPAPPRPASTETTSFPSHTPELELDHGSRASSINAASTTGTGKTIKVVQWTPQRGQEGTQVTIILDSAVIRFAAPSIHNPTSTPNFGDGSPSGSSPTGPVNRSFSVMFGQAVAPTEFTRAQAIDGNGVGHSMTAGPNEEDAFVVLTTFAPARNLMGGVGEPILVVVRVLDESGSTVESSIIGNWDAGAVPPSPTRLQSLKRAGDPLGNDRDGPGIPSPSHSQNGSPSRPGVEWSAPSHAPQLAIPAIRTSSSDPDAPLAAPTALPTPQLGGGQTQFGGQPELVRTSQISGPKTGTGGSYSHKVVLKLQGDLNTMAMGWSNEEWQNRRRLIQFWPQQDGNIVNVAFRPVAQNDWQPNSITVSCIFRDDWNECFVTSVDTIYLLEALVGSRFSVEEKNRIRRNLEGFKPLTVSKSKPDAESFFKLIMGFPQPKPRNIEKDVKVFPWKILSNALKKIMSKYSANYPLATDGSANTFGRNEGGHLAAPLSPRMSNSPASPGSQVNQSPHLVQSPNVANASTPGHFPHNSTPHPHQSPRLGTGNNAAFVPRSPQVQSLPHSPVMPPHSPQRMHNLVPPPAPGYSHNTSNRSSYEPPSAPSPYDARDYSLAQPSTMYASNGSGAGGGGHHHASQLFPSAEDYGVSSQPNQHQHHHLAPIHASNPNSSLNHYRSYSEGMPRTTQDGNGALYAATAPPPFQPYDASATTHGYYSQPQSSWIPPNDANGNGTGTEHVDGNPP
ncbi:hypothetical protein JCM3766R1_006971 [Sporobolomyces carnicolor]